MALRMIADHVRRVFVPAPLLLAALTSLLVIPVPTSVSAADLAERIRELNGLEWQLVSGQVNKRLPSLIKGENERAYFERLLRSADDTAEMVQAVDRGNYNWLAAVADDLAARERESELQEMIADRYGKDSSMYRSFQVAKHSRGAAKRLVRAAFKSDAVEARNAIRDALQDYAEEVFTEKVSDLQGDGVKLWKDMLLKVVPGGHVKAFGFTPLDVYLQVLIKWKNVTEKLPFELNDVVLDCLQLRYDKLRSDGETADQARERIEDAGLGPNMGRTFDCRAEMEKRDPAYTWPLFGNYAAKLGNTSAVEGQVKLDRGEIVDLIRQYEADGGFKGSVYFSEWLRKRLARNIRTRASALREEIAAERDQVDAGQRSEAEKLRDAIAAEIAKLDRSRPRKDPKKPAGEDTPVAGEQGEKEDASGRAADKGNDKDEPVPEPEKVTVNCDKLTALVASARRASVRKSSALISELSTAETAAREEGNCSAEVFAAANEARDRLQKIAALGNRLQAAIRSCNIDALPSLKSEAASLGSSAFDNEITLLQTARTGVNQFNKGKATFDSGKYAAAKAPLRGAVSALKELPSGACQAYADRAQDGLDKIDKVLAQQAIVNRAIDACNVADLKTILAKYKGRKFRFFTDSVARIKAVLPKCQEEERVIAEGKFCDKARGKLEAALADLQDSKFKPAWSALRALDKTLTKSNTKRCSDLPGRVRRGLGEITEIRKDNSRLNRAAKACDIDSLKKLAARYKREDHRWYKNASALAIGSIEACEETQPITEAEAIADCRKQVAAKGKVYAKTDYKPDGTYKCHWCEKGEVSNGVSCVPDTAAAEADCRKQVAAKGMVYAKTEFLNDGRYVCHWCKPGEVYANGQCGTAAAHGEAHCRRIAASKGKVYGATVFRKNGKYDCFWCDPGEVYANGQCYAQQQAQPRRPSPQTGGSGGSGPLYLCTHTFMGVTKQYYLTYPPRDSVDPCRRIR